MKNIIAAIFITFLIFASCKKSQEARPLTHINFSKETLAWAYIPVNRYYIYRDSVSGNEDSIYCFHSQIYDEYVPAPIGFTANLNPPFYHQDYDLILRRKGQSSDWYNITIFAWSPYGRGRNYDSAYISYGGPNIGFFFQNDSSNYLRSVVVNGKIYTDIVYSYDTDNGDTAQTGPYAIGFYWAKGIGVIQRKGRIGGDSVNQVLERYGD